jgi:acyl transferase domain-containing protein/acyl carrier protein
MNNPEPPSGSESIAIVGMSGRFPKAKNLETFWGNLRDGVECISFFSERDLAAAGADPGALSDPSFVNAGGVLEDIDLFDASFFGFSARDAEIMDPQQRIFLECAWHSLEDAGYSPETYPGLIGVFAGTAMSTYLFNLYSEATSIGFVDDFQMMIGNAHDHLTTQVSYKLNLRGPSVAVQTACSTSLVAVCMACQSLLSYQCDMALAGGVAVNISQRKGYVYQPGGILSPDGHCRAFDAKGQGFVAGNGVGIVVLKRLSEALADGDNIRAVVKGSAINNDGSLKVGYTAPSVDGQAQVIALALATAGVEPETIGYIEAHGTATPLGDPIEIAALNQVFNAHTQKKGCCAIGSVKSNIGHLDPAAGVASLIKTVLALEHRQLPPSLHFVKPNPEIDFARSPFYVNTTCSAWNSNGLPRRAGVSSFGIGGTNAHVILEEAPQREPSAHSRPCCILVLSARTSSALEVGTDNLVEYLAQNPAVDLADVAYTSHIGRKAFNYRRLLVCQSPDLDDARSALEGRHPQRVFTAVCEPKERLVVFMFPGQGTQDVDMGLELYSAEPTFREQVDFCSELLRPHLGLDLRDLLYPTFERRESAARTLRQTALTQPALFTIEYALAKLWMEWGIRPRAMIGHSIGEYVAACLAGVFSLDDGLALVATRGQLMERMPEGAMIAVALSEADVQPFLSDGLSLAAVNGPSLCVLSGPTDSVEKLVGDLAKNATGCRRLHTSHAFHSSMMDPVESSFVSTVKTMRLKAPQIPYLSNVTGTWITAQAAMSPTYWGRQLRQTVRFADGLQQLLKAAGCVLLEVGPGQTLSTVARQQTSQEIVFSSLPPVRREHSELSCLLNTLGKLWLCGVQVNWNGFYAHERRHRVPLPTYPFERQRYWIGPPEYQEAVTASSQVASPGRDIADWFYAPSWEYTTSPEHNGVGLAAKPSSWLVFEDRCGVGHHMVSQLEQAGHRIISVRAAQEYSRTDLRTYEINPREREHYWKLFGELSALNRLPERIVHMWNVGPDDPEKSALEVFEQHQETGFHSLLCITQALIDQGASNAVQMAAVSSNLYLVNGEEQICPAQATLLGACNSIPQEYPNIRCRNLDVVVPNLGVQAPDKLAGDLVAELSSGSPDTVVAYRGGQRWVQVFEPMPLPESHDAIPTLRESGVYLITGGLGKIGLTLAESLARGVRAKLVLTGRSAFPNRNEWEQWLGNDAHGVISRKIRKLLQLEEFGAEVVVFSADSAERDQMSRVVAEAYARFGAIHGVIHGAGDTAAHSAIGQTDPAVAEQHFRPKVRGLLVLEELLREKELDFFLVLSSLSSVLGGLGLVAYSAANNFLDAFAGQQNQKGTVPWISVNWDAWQFPVDDEQDGTVSHQSTDFILPEEGAEAFRRILERAPGQIVVSTTDLQTRLDQWIKLESLRKAPPSQSQNSAPQHPRPNLTSQYVPPGTATEQTIAEMWQQLLGVGPVGAQDNFFELGGHSLLAIQLISRLRETFQIELSVHRVFETPTIAELAESIEKDRTAAVEEREARTAQILDLVEQLSEGQVTALLGEGNNLPEGGNLRDV